MMTKFRSVFYLAFILGVLAGSTASLYAAALQGITSPSSDITLSFVLAGRVTDVLVQEGQLVKKNQLLARLFDEPERIQSRQLEMLSADRTRILAAEAELAQKKVDFRKLEMAKSKGAASDWEVEHLKLNVRIAQLALETAVLEQEQYRRGYEHSVSQLERMRLVAPIQGVVEHVGVEAGESVGTLGPVLRLVNNDPLWIDLPVPSAQAIDLAVGQAVWIAFPNSDDIETANGKIINISAVVDAASDTRRVRVEVQNDLKRPAGERVAIDFKGHKDDPELAQLKK